MSRKKRLIIPVFIPFGGCPQRCVFCDQKGIAGSDRLPGVEEVKEKVEAYLATWKGTGRREVAFYGGSFTGLPMEAQLRYLESVSPYISSGRIDGVRVSTRPDYITGEKVRLLKLHGVEVVELGVQSMSDDVLALSGRGHTSEDTRTAFGLLKGEGLTVGVQVMPGLPGDTADTAAFSARELVSLEADFSRIYPTLVLKGTVLHRMYLEGAYTPWSLDEMVSAVSKIYAVFISSGVPVIRVGLQPTKELEDRLVAGPYHPSFRQLVEKTSTPCFSAQLQAEPPKSCNFQ